MPSRLAVLAAALVSAATLASSSARAQGYTVTAHATDPVFGAITITGLLSGSYTPNAGGGSFSAPATGMFTSGFGAQAFVGTVDFYLANASNCGGFDFYASGYTYLDACGPQLFTGSVGAPQLMTGTYTGFSVANGQTNLPQVSDLTITATPEPGTWMLLAGGLAGVGVVASRRRRAGAMV